MESWLDWVRRLILVEFREATRLRCLVAVVLVMRRLRDRQLAGAHTIIAVDIDDRKLEWAKGFGATHTVNSRETDAVEAIQGITGGNGADVCIEAVGLPQTYEQAFFARDLGGDGCVGGCAESGDEDYAADD